jgi:SAM-dependent methyltransferase
MCAPRQVQKTCWAIYCTTSGKRSGRNSLKFRRLATAFLRQQARLDGELRRYLFARAGIENARRSGWALTTVEPVLEDVHFPPPASDHELWRSGIIHGIDLSAEYLSLAQTDAPFANLIQGDGHQLPYASSSFEIVFCHFLLLWVAEPQTVVNEMARIVRPGGAVLALAEPDYGGRIDYPEEFSELGLWQEQALRRQGADTRLGRRLSIVT